MRITPRLQAIDRQIQAIKTSLLALSDMRPGSLSLQYNICGTAGCACKDPHQPKRHGPYFQLHYVYRGKHTSEYVREADVAQVRAELATFKEFRRLSDQWVGLALQRAKLKLKQKS